MIFTIIAILIIFTIFTALIWLWFFRNEIAFCEKLYDLGITALEKKEYKRAKTYFSKIVNVSSEYKEIRLNLGIALLNLGKYKEAKENFEIAIKISPESYVVLFNLAQAHQHLKEYERAKEYYKRALAQNDKSVYCCINLGLIDYYQKDYAHGLEYFEKANTLLPGNDEILYYITRCKDELCSYDENCDGDEIIKSYLSIANNQNLPKEINLFLAKAYAKLGQIEMAKKHCQESLSKSPKDIESYKLLGAILLIEKDFDSVKQLLKQALNIQPKNKDLHLLLSYSLCHQVDNCSLGKCMLKYQQMLENFLKAR